VQDQLHGRTTRIDVAFDDQDGLLDLDVVGRHLDEGLYVARWTRTDYHRSKINGVWGESRTLGSGRSDTMLRIYDKRAERLQKGHEVEHDHWLRVELQLRRKRANAAADQLKTKARDVWAYMAGVVRYMVDFKERGTSDQKTRWPVALWWARFLGFAEKARLVVEKEVKTLDHVKAWVWTQVAPSLAVLEEGMGFDDAWSFVYQTAQEGHKRLRPRHRAILAASGVG